MSFGAPAPGMPAMPGMSMPMYGYGMPRPMPGGMPGLTSQTMSSTNPMLGGADVGVPGNFANVPMSYPQFTNGMMFPGIPATGLPAAMNPNAASPFPAPGAPGMPGAMGVGKAKKQLGRPRKYPVSEVPDMRFAQFGQPEASRKKEPAPVPQLKSRLKPPKQSPSAWQIFFTEELQKIKAASPEERLNVAHVAKDAGLRYAALPESERQKFQERSQEAKEQYEKDLAAWRAKLTPDDIRHENMFRSAQRKLGKSRRGNLKDPNAPKKPLSAYFLFLRTIRTDPEMSKEVLEGEHETTKQSVLAAAKWRTLSDEEKQPYLDQADKDKAEYERLRREYEESRGITRPSTSHTPAHAVHDDEPPSSVGFDAEHGELDDLGDAKHPFSLGQPEAAQVL